MVASSCSCVQPLACAPRAARATKAVRMIFLIFLRVFSMLFLLFNGLSCRAPSVERVVGLLAPPKCKRSPAHYTIALQRYNKETRIAPAHRANYRDLGLNLRDFGNHLPIPRLRRWAQHGAVPCFPTCELLRPGQWHGLYAESEQWISLSGFLVRKLCRIFA